MSTSVTTPPPVAIVPADMALKGLIQTIQGCIEKNSLHCDLNHLDISQYESLNDLFSYELSQFNGDISGWDTSNVKTMVGMFKTSRFKGDISRWNVSRVVDMSEMFYSSHFDGNIAPWNVSNVERMTRMFSHSSYTGDLSDWNVSRVRSMREMFFNCKFNGDLSRWNVSHVLDMHEMFAYSSIGDISNWDVSSVRDLAKCMYFATCQSDLGAWNIHPEASVDYMLHAADFHGSFPRVPLTESSWHVLPDSYFGDLGDYYTLDEAKVLVQNKKWLDLYLKTTAPQRLSSLHMAKAVMLKTKPSWMTAADFKWAKEQHVVCMGLGMDRDESARWMATAYVARKDALDQPVDSIALAFDAQQ